MLISAVSSISVCDWQDLHAMQNLIVFVPTVIGREHGEPKLVVEDRISRAIVIITSAYPSCVLYCG